MYVYGSPALVVLTYAADCSTLWRKSSKLPRPYIEPLTCLSELDKSFCHAIVIGKRTSCLESGQLFLYPQGKGFQFRNATRGADTDPGGGSLALLVFEEMKKLLRQTI